MGCDKASLAIDGQPLWRRQAEVLHRLRPAQLMISGPARGAYESVADAFENAGPLAGISAALEKCTSSHLVVLAVDLPQMTTAFLRDLLVLCGDETGVVPQGQKFFEPLAAVYPAACTELAATNLRCGEFSMQKFIRAALAQRLLTERPILPNEQALFANLNAPADL